MKKICLFSIILILTISMALSANGSQEKETDDEIIVGRILLFTIDEYQNAAREIAYQFAEERGAKLLVDSYETDLEVERQLVEDFITRGADVIILQAFENTDVDEMNKLCREAGVPLVEWYVEGNDEPYTFCGVDEGLSSYEMGAQAATAWKKIHPDTPVKIGALIQEKNQAIFQARTLSWIDGVKSVEPDAEVIMQQMINECAFDKVQADFEDMMSANPDINMISSPSSATSLLAHNILLSMGRGTIDTEMICSWNGDINEYVKMKDPKSSYRFTVGMSPFMFEKMCWDTAFKLLSGELSTEETNKVYSGAMVLSEAKDWTDFFEKGWGKSLDDALASIKED